MCVKYTWSLFTIQVNGLKLLLIIYCIWFLFADSILHQLFIVRFLGSMEVKVTENADVIYETMRQILAARAIHNIFRMTESHLLVTCECLKYENNICMLLQGNCFYSDLLVSLTFQTHRSSDTSHKIKGMFKNCLIKRSFYRALWFIRCLTLSRCSFLFPAWHFLRHIRKTSACSDSCCTQLEDEQTDVQSTSATSSNLITMEKRYILLHVYIYSKAICICDGKQSKQFRITGLVLHFLFFYSQYTAKYCNPHPTCSALFSECV